MRTFQGICMALALATASASCATTSTSTTTWTEPAGAARPGHVESVTELVQRTQGQPAAGAIAGALIGSLLFRGGFGRLFGATAGAVVGGEASQGSSESRLYQVTVRFDDGRRQVFAYRDASPFRPGDLVLATGSGLVRR